MPVLINNLAAFSSVIEAMLVFHRQTLFWVPFALMILRTLPLELINFQQKLLDRCRVFCQTTATVFSMPILCFLLVSHNSPFQGIYANVMAGDDYLKTLVFL